MEKINKDNICSSCYGCESICPKNAINVIDNQAIINNDLCINCNICTKVCQYNHLPALNYPLEGYALISKNYELYNKSASGGVFSTLAAEFLKQGGYVVGAAIEYIDNKIIVRHKIINRFEELDALLSSKYVQSDISGIYSQIRKLLDDNKKILFSGTPCQVAGLLSFLPHKYSNLITIDLICHGVISQKIFHKFVNCLEKEYKAKLIDFNFRDKSKQTSISSFSAKFKTKKRIFTIVKPWYEFAYYYLFVNGISYVPVCYNCGYAKVKRVSDITIGDFWGVEIYEKEKSEKLYNIIGKKSVSCALINTTNGQKFVEDKLILFIFFNCCPESISKGNNNLNYPSKILNEKINEKYLNLGIERFYSYYNRKRRRIRIIAFYNRVNRLIRRVLKRILGKFKT